MTSLDELKARVAEIPWFHTIDLGDGVVTNGIKSTAILSGESGGLLDPIDFSGAHVADIGAWNGYYSVAAKQRGAAQVTSVDEYSWIRPNFRGRESIELVNERLDLDLVLRQVSIAETSPESIGQHDIVFFFGVFYHLFDAQTDLRRIADCAKDCLIIETYQDALDQPRPAMVFYPGATLNNDASNWWGPNPPLMRELLHVAGFERVFYRPHPVYGVERGMYHAFRDDAALKRWAVSATMPGSTELAAGSPESTISPHAAGARGGRPSRTPRNLMRFLLGRPMT